MDTADERQLGGRGRCGCRSKTQRRVYFTGTAETPIEQQLYWVSYDMPGRAAAGDRAGLVQQGGDGQGRHPCARHPLKPRPTVTDLSRRRGGQAPGLGRAERARRFASLCALSRQPCEADFRHRGGTGRHAAPLPDAGAASWSLGSAIPSSVYVYGGPHGPQVTALGTGDCRSRDAGRQGLDRVHASTIAGPTGAGRSSKPRSITRWAMPRSPTSSPASMAEAPAVCRSRRRSR